MDYFGRNDYPFEQRLAEGKAKPNPGEAWDKSLENSVLSASQLDVLKIVPRQILIESWARQGDLGFIFAARGIGKTWFGMHLAYCLASHKDFGPWKCPPGPSPHKILYMDGEMAIEDTQYRNHVLGACSDKLFYLNHEILFERSSRVLNLSNSELQEAILSFCKEYKFSILILDNLSTLVSGVDENSCVDWEKILPWLLRLRRGHITVIFIHHAGRDPDHMRGHTKREDPSAWIIKLKLPKNDPEHESDGAHFISSFDKYRNSPTRPEDTEWSFTPINNGSEILVRTESSNPMDVFMELVSAGVEQNSEIAEEMGLSNATVTRLAQKAERNGLIEIKKRKYSIKTSHQAPYNPSDD